MDRHGTISQTTALHRRVLAYAEELAGTQGVLKNLEATIAGADNNSDERGVPRDE
jgi:hypothetical protein